MISGILNKTQKNAVSESEEQDTTFLSSVVPAETELDLARSAWFDHVFAVWFAQFAKSQVLFHGTRGEAFFKECGEFSKKHKVAMGASGDDAKKLLTDKGALDWFKSMSFPELPYGATHKPTTWQMEKARRYLKSRHNTLLSQRLEDAERVREEGDSVRADMIATEARRLFSAFSDSVVCCVKALEDVDGILSLAESNPPLFTLDGEIGRLLNSRLKPDNLGVILANQKIGKTTTLVSLASIAARSVPTLFISAGDETRLKIDARLFTNLSFHVTQPEYAGTFAMPVPDCEHNADGTCPIGLSGEPRQNKSWKALIESGYTPEQLADGLVDGSRTVTGGLYKPCCHCFPRNDGTKEDRERRQYWKSAVWWRNETFHIGNRKLIDDTRRNFELSSPNGGLRIAAYPTGSLTMEMIYELLDTLDRTENFVPRVIFLDYVDIMKQKTIRASDKDHDGLRIIWEELRGLTSKLDLLLISPTQTNRQGDEIETHTIRTLGRCAKAADNCTWMLTLNQTINERRAKIMRGSMLFAREGRFDPEHQAMCCQWLEIQDSFAFSMPIFCKTKYERNSRND